MTKTIKKTMQWFLIAIFALSFVLGASLLLQSKTAKAADMTVTFNAAYLEGTGVSEGQGEKVGYLQVRMDTEGQTWTNSYNNKSVSELPGNVADTVTINGRTLRELDSACNSASSVIVTMQPAGSFSFIRVWIPNDFMTLSDVRSLGVLDGFEFVDGTTTIKGTAVTYLRTGDTLVTESAYTATTKLTSSVVTVSDAQLVHRKAIEDSVNYGPRGADSYVVQISWDRSFGEYDAMYNNYASVRKAIYINGKSIDEWNAQAIASDSKFAETSTYTYYPQNSTDANHKDVFVKPVGLWGYSGGFILTIYQELVSDCEEIVVTVGSGCWLDGSFMVSERISKTVWTQSVVNVTNKLTFLDNSHNNPADWGETKMYMINTNNESCWTKAPVGGCLNEYDPSNAGGGQVQMKYIYFNGSTLWDINATDNGSYNSTQGNIASGGVYAPILVTMSAELGSSLKLTVPTNFTNGKAGHEEIIIKKGFSVYENGVSYYVSNDIIFTNTGNGWSKTVKGNEIATEVVGVMTKANRTDGGSNENFVIFQLSNNDYASCNTTAISDISGLYGYIDINGNLLESKPNEPFFNVWGTPNSVAFRAPGLDATGLQNVQYITIKAGAKFPSYNSQNGGSLTYYVTSQDVTFVHDIPYDTWSVGSAPSETTTFTVTFMVDGNVYTTVEVAEKTEGCGYGYIEALPVNPTKAEDANYTYEFSKWIIPDTGKQFSKLTKLTGDLTVEAEFTAIEKEDVVMDLTSGLTLHHQGQQAVGTETYIIYTDDTHWTKAPLGGCLNEYDFQDEGAGQEQMKYIYFNGTSLYDINKNDNGSYGSAQGNIASGGRYAPILVLMGLDSNSNKSYIQLHVPTGYPNVDATADDNHKTIEIKAGFTVVENDVTYTVTQDVKWYNVNGTWKKGGTQAFGAEDVTIDNVRIEGNANELYKVDITSSRWNIECNDYDFMYGGNYATYRQYFYINGVSVYDINANTDDSAYVYSTFPMTGADDATFAHPVLIETHKQGDNPNKITLWIHKTYFETLNNELVITLGAGYNAYTADGLVLGEDITLELPFQIVTIDDGTNMTEQSVPYGCVIAKPSNPTKAMTSTTIYEFDNWYNAQTDTVFDFSAPITAPVTIEARFNETTINLIETEVVGIVHYLKTSNDNWMSFELSEHDYGSASDNYSMGGYVELLRIGFLDKVTLKGTIVLNDGSTVSEATLMDIYNSYGPQEGPLLNFWALNQFAMRMPVGNGVTEIIIEENCFFPSYAYVSCGTSTDTRYFVTKPQAFKYDEATGVFEKQASVAVDIQMEKGASVRITSNMATSGIRFTTKILKTDVEKLNELVTSGKCVSVSYGTIIVPTDYITGGSFNHDWLIKNYGGAGVGFIEIETDRFYRQDSTEGDYYYFHGSIVKLKETNYDRYFSAIGYVKLVYADRTEYIYASYDSANSRSASFVAESAIKDRKAEQEEKYTNYISADGNWSRFTVDENGYLEAYIVNRPEQDYFATTDLTELASKGGAQTITVEKKLEGPYVQLLYSTNVNVWGKFNYTDGNKSASEDFYLQAGTSEHKQYLDLFRSNGVAYGMDASNITMTSITFTNAELDNSTVGVVRIIGMYSYDKTIDTSNQEIYLTVAQTDGSEMTVGAHLGLGGALTYLAKSGIYEGLTGSIFSRKVAISTSTSDFSDYYGHATSSKAADGAVNLINNTDAGRQIQQSWYAAVGGTSDATANENGYTRAFCKTESSTGKYWPYNPVQAGDVVSNPSQIIDYEINVGKGYIYVKTRAMDWAKGQKSSDKLANTIVGGETTKSYMENYYRLKADGTLTVNNTFVDWNGFTDMESCDWASTELPAVYPVHTLNYYVSNLDGDGTWTDGLEYNNGLGSWTNISASCRQFSSASKGYTKVEDWFAWANGNSTTSFALGMYIPNVERLTSGRSTTSTNQYSTGNNNASETTLKSKGLMSNMQPIIKSYQSTYVSNTSYTAPGIDYRMEAYKKIEYSYVICVGTVDNIRSTFKDIKDNGTVTNAGVGYQKVGLDAWARADKSWTW